MVEGYKYLGHVIKLGLDKSKLNNSLKRKVFESMCPSSSNIWNGNSHINGGVNNKVKSRSTTYEASYLMNQTKRQEHKRVDSPANKVNRCNGESNNVKMELGGAHRMEDDRWINRILDWRPPTTG